MSGARGQRELSRRHLVQGAGAVGLGLLAGCGRLPWQSPGQAQAPNKVPRIGHVGVGAPGTRNPQALRAGLQELGYVEGQNLTIEWRSTGGNRESVVEAVRELVALQVDLMVVTGVNAAEVAQNATRTIPIVIVTLTNPVESGFVASLARPGGNITGVGAFALELSGKQLQLLAEAIPSVARVGVLWQASQPGRSRQLQEVQEAASALGIEVESLAVGDAQQLARIIQSGIQARIDALFALQSNLLVTQLDRILDWVAEGRLPGMYEDRQWTEAGGLMSYGPSFPAMHRRAAYYVDRMLRGDTPAELPVERPREFEFVINLRTAQALGLTIPHHVLLQATEVIQ
jgi:putative tryptophan/tyrosine transport system substrate-binding protein